MMIIEVTRKGGKRDSVNVAGFAKSYLEAYMSIRQQRYKAEKTDTAFFLSEYRGLPNRIDASSIEKMVAKYSADFKIRVTPHKLRHTLATRLYDATKSQVLVSHQLVPRQYPGHLTSTLISSTMSRKMLWINYSVT